MDEKLSTALKSLPRTEAGPHFTASVLQRIGEPKQPKGMFLWPRLAVASLVLLMLVFGGREWWHYRQHQNNVARLEALRQEQKALLEELYSLKRLDAEARPVVYLGSDQGVDLVFDLSRYRQADGRVALPTEQLIAMEELLQRNQKTNQIRPANLTQRPTF